MNSELADRVTTANYLWLLADQMREERLRWKHPAIRGNLEHAIDEVELCARKTIGTLELTHADAMADAAQATLRQIVGMRKLLEHVEPENGSNRD